MTGIKAQYLDQLLKDFELLSELVLKQIISAGQLLENNSTLETYVDVERNENLIDGLDVKIREEVINAIFLFTPRATDLRKIIAYHDMTIYLERIGDLLLNITNFTKEIQLNMTDFDPFMKILRKMFRYVEDMVRNAVFAFSGEDDTMAYATISTDDKVDVLFKEVNDKLRRTFKDRPLSEQELKNVMIINSISYNIERIGDNATNIAESAIYLMEGKDIRHKHNNSE